MTAMPLLFLRLTLTAALVALSATTLFAQTAQTRYQNALARETKVREALAVSPDAGQDPQAATEAVRVIAAYEALVARYPVSGYADNALFNAASLADLLHQRYGLAKDRTAAIRLYGRVGREYPASSLIRRAGDAIARLDSVETTGTPTPLVPPVTASAALPSTPASRARLTSIDRVVLNDVVRITLSLDHEVSYREQTLEGPRRVFFDLRGVEASPGLGDAVLRYSTDAVRQIRVGRHPNSTVRVVLDLDGVTRHSVYTLYNPFRLVIDCEPATATTARTTEASAARPTPTPRADAAPTLTVRPPPG